MECGSEIWESNKANMNVYNLKRSNKILGCSSKICNEIEGIWV